MIKKISDLKIAESFVQISFIKGYKYIDKAGEIVNEFHVGDKEPLFTMDLGGLVINSPENEISEIKISSQMYWAHFIEPSSLESIVSSYLKKCEKINEILGIQKVKRVGWRLYFVKEFNKESERDDAFHKLNLDSDIVFEAGLYSIKKNDYDAKIRFRKATKLDDNKTPSLIIDIDLFKIAEANKNIGIGEIKTFLNEFKTELRSDFWLNVLNKIIESGQKSKE